ncbi:MAG: hypothetical protein KatS3mg082_1800 [Nitrospiraceae bacterium]|nr:MAG: hypothetical protein KatS3mg082_1800 [Nitrospiraceae bacterium]
MPRLKNPRHERFAQLLAEGVGIADAYIAAGFDCNKKVAPRNAWRLLNRCKGGAEILRRRDELLAEREREYRAERQKIAEEVRISKAEILQKLWENAMVGAERDKHGKPNNLGASNQALELLGRELHGLFVQTSRILSDPSDTLSVEQLRLIRDIIQSALNGQHDIEPILAALGGQEEGAGSAPH